MTNEHDVTVDNHMEWNYNSARLSGYDRKTLSSPITLEH